MIRPVKNTSLLMRMAWRLSNGKKRWLEASQNVIQPYVQYALEHNDGTLTRGIQHKLKDYPLEGVFAAQLIADLHQYTLSEKAIRHLAMCGAVLALGDVFCDDTDLTFEQVEQMLQEPHQCKAVTTIEKLFVAIYKDLLIELDDHWQPPFHQALMNGFDAEKDSRLLRSNTIDTENVFRIICNKGGKSLLIYRSLICQPMVQGEEQALFLAGAFTQLIDDVFDLYWDLRKQVQTSATTSSTYEQLTAQLEQHYNTLSHAVKESELQHEQAYAFMYVFNIFRKGVLLYIRQLHALTSGKLRPETILALSEEDIRFRPMRAGNVARAIPAAMSFRY
jgi:hypothetical protein